MKPILAILILLVSASSAAAAPPSSKLTGPNGKLSWTVTTSGTTVSIEGASPKWTVQHEANLDLTPRRTVRSDADGNTVTVVYGADSTAVTLPNKTVTHERGDLWDADTFDVRLGDRIARGAGVDFRFDAVDPASGKVYGFSVETVDTESCGGAPCTHVKVRLTGVLRMVGPSWEYRFAASGKLVKFDGPIGTFTAQVSAGPKGAAR